MWALTVQGCRLGRRVAEALQARLFVPEKCPAAPGEQVFHVFGETVRSVFHGFAGHVFIAATGIVVRTIAPVLRGKSKDPAVVVLDQKGRHAVSLLGGHAAGANALAVRVAEVTGGEAVITTATDTSGLPALDVLARDLDLVPDSPAALKKAAVALLLGETVQVWDPELRLRPSLDALGHKSLFVPVRREEDWIEGRPGVWVTWRDVPPLSDRLVLFPRCLAAGLGLHRGVGAEELVSFVAGVFQNNGLALSALGRVGTIADRSGEPGLREMAEALGVELVFFTKGQLGGVRVPNPSPTASRLIGIPSVCEAAAILAGGKTPLLISKTASLKTTLAVGLVG